VALFDKIRRIPKHKANIFNILSKQLRWKKIYAKIAIT